MANLPRPMSCMIKRGRDSSWGKTTVTFGGLAGPWGDRAGSPCPCPPQAPTSLLPWVAGLSPTGTALMRVHDGTWDPALAAIKDHARSTLGQIQSTGFEKTSPFTESGHKTVASHRKCIPLN